VSAPVAATGLIAERVANVAGLPEAAFAMATTAFVDCVGVMLAGSREAGARILAQTLQLTEGRARLVGSRLRASPTDAALINGTSAHALDFDDVSPAMVGHPSAVLVPAVLAVAEDTDASGAAVLEAFIVGFEVAARLGRALNPGHYERGWHATGTLGAPAAAAAVAHLLHLDAAHTQTALAIAGSLAAGMRASFGTMVKPLHAGHAARTGVLAARLAAGGFSAAQELFEAQRGYGEMFVGSATPAGSHGPGNPAPDWAAALEPWDWSEPEILRSGVQLKPFPSCAATHTAIDALLSLRETIRAADVVGIDVCVTPLVPQILIHSRPRTGLEGKFSMEYCLAVTLLDGQPGTDQFADARASRDDVQRLLRCVDMRVDPSLPEDFGSGRMPVKVSARLVDGRVVSADRVLPPGAPQRQLTRGQLEQKFLSNASGVVGDAHAALDLLSDLRHAAHIAEVVDRLTS